MLLIQSQLFYLMELGKQINGVVTHLGGCHCRKVTWSVRAQQDLTGQLLIVVIPCGALLRS